MTGFLRWLLGNMNNPEKNVPFSTGAESRPGPALESGLFLIVLLFEIVLFFSLVGGRRIIGGHDGFQYLTFQYYFLNNVVNYGDIPLWIPFMTHGTVATWWYVVQSSILQNVFILCGGFLKAFNFLPLFYTAAFIDELLLLSGVWLLGKRFFNSPWTVFFVAVSVMGSCVWVVQPWWNFHLYYALPLILHFGHRFLETGKWRYYFLAGNLLFIQCLGNLPYFFPYTVLVVFLYFLFYVIFNRHDVRQQIGKIRSIPSFVFCTAILLLLFIALYTAMKYGTESITSYNFRNPDGASSLTNFLNYGGKLHWQTWVELFSGISPALDYTLYTGIVFIPLILFGLIFNTRRKNAHFILTLIVLLAFSMGTFVSIFFYYCWPLMKYFRHLALTITVIKLFLCFMAGFGFDALFFNPSSRNALLKKGFLAVMSILTLGTAFYLWRLAGDYPGNFKLFIDLVELTVPRYLSVNQILFDNDLIPLLLKRTACFDLVFAAMFLALAFQLKHLTTRGRFYYLALIAILSLHIADLYGLKYFDMKIKTAPLNKNVYALTEFQELPYAKRRDASFDSKNPRAGLLQYLPVKSDAFYWSTDALLFADELGSPFNTCNWLGPFDNYMKAYWGQPINDLSIKPRGFYYYSHLEFPEEHPAALKIAGVTEDKIQFFRQAKIVPSEERIASWITAPDYNGDMLFLSPLQEGDGGDTGRADAAAPDLSANMRLHYACQVNRFDSNNLEVSTDIGDNGSAWLMYSDVWHPLWRATVNGKDAPVYRANLAYKAVKLEKGKNRVRFYFKSGLMSLFYFLFSLNALLWLGIILFLVGRIVFAGIIPRHSGPRRLCRNSLFCPSRHFV